jgi:hypothetical protein
LSETDVLGKLRRYEQLLKSHGVKLDDDEEEPQIIEEPSQRGPETTNTATDWNGRTTIGLAAPRAPDTEAGSLFIHKEEAHYVEKYVPYDHTVSRSHLAPTSTKFDANARFLITVYQKPRINAL